jgi:hypothetical protein
MQILAGHPQYVFYTGVAAVIYTGIRIVWAEEKLKIALCFIGMYTGAVALSAAQLLPGMQFTQESIRGMGVSYEFASVFSFPPQNFLTWFVPGFFGDMVHFPYWGKWFLWEMSVFISVTGFGLAVYAVVFGTGKQRYIFSIMVVILMVLALGTSTPLFRFLYDYVPGFNKFRGISKFTLQSTLFLIILSGMGLDLMLRQGVKGRKKLILVFFALAVAGVVCAEGIRRSAEAGPEGYWQETLHAVFHSAPPLRSPGFFSDQDSLREAGRFAAKNVMAFAGICLLVGTVLFLSKFQRNLVYLLFLLAIAELFVFARMSRETFELSEPPQNLVQYLARKGGDYRFFDFIESNSAMSLRTLDIWGADPGVLRRYAEFMAFTQGLHPDKVTQDLRLRHGHRLYDMLRCRYIILRKKGKIHVRDLHRNVIPRFTLIRDWHIATGRDRILAMMNDGMFDPRYTAILEQDPKFPKYEMTNQRGEVKLLDSSTDHLTIEADLPEPAILLISDAYSEGWRAHPLNGSVQNTYDVMPANYVLQAVPLAAGHHHFRLEYLPTAFLAGKWVSIVSLCIYLSAILWFWRRGCRTNMTT